MVREQKGSWIWALFRAPRFEGEDELSRTAEILTSLLNQLTVINLLATFIGVPFAYAQKLGSLIAVSLIWAVLIGSRWLMWRGRVRAASILLVSVLWIVFFGLVCLTGGLYSINNVFLISLTVSAGLLLGARAAIVTAVTSIIFAGVLVLLSMAEIELPQPFPALPLSRLLQLTVGLMLTITPLNLALRNLAKALADAREQLRERQRANEALSREKDFSDALVDAMPGIFIMIERSGQLIRWNEELERVVKLDEETLKTMTVDDIFDADAASDLIDRIDARDSRDHLEREAQLRDGEQVEHPFFLSAWPRHLDDKAYLIVVGIDISERIRLEQQLTQAQKMESVGRLAGGIAHDFNNLLTGIIGNASLAMLKVEAGSQVEERLQDIDRAADSAAQLTRQLLAFSRKQVVVPRLLDINEHLRGLPRLLKRLLREDIELETRLASERCVVKIDPGQAEQIVVNLAVNARDAMPNGGRLTIATCSFDVDVPQIGQCISEDLPPGRYVLLEIRDTGEGIAPEDLNHIFEPFFTTKEEGKGTGLGLATVYGLVAQNGGHIEVSTELGQGTSFKVYLPRRDAEASPSPVVGDEASKARSFVGEGLVMLVEDEEVVRDLAKMVLEHLGFQVISCANGDEAIQASGAVAEPIALLVTDVIMPGLNGKELADRLCAERDDLKVLFTSGYPQSVIAKHGVLDEGINFLPKPYTPDQLTEKIAQILAGKGVK